jgi:BolA protein
MIQTKFCTLLRMDGLRIEHLLNCAFSPHVLRVTDDSNQHKGHRGTPHKNHTHFSVTIVSSAFEGMPVIQRHRAVHAVLSQGFSTTLHALKLITKTPSEWHHAS